MIGATTTMADLIASAELAAAVPILRETALVIADPQVRARGTLGGNVANGDPGNDMPALMQCLGASYLVAGSAGSRARSLPATSTRAPISPPCCPGEVVTAIRIPLPPAGHGWAYEKLKRKVGDYATAAAGVVLTLQGGRVAQVAIGLTNVGDTPLFAEEAGDDPDRLDAGRRDRGPGGRGGGGHHRTRLGRPRPGRLPHQDGRRDAAPRARPRRRARRRAMKGRNTWPRPM